MLHHGEAIKVGLSCRRASKLRPLPLLFVAFLSLFVFPRPSPPWVINVIIIVPYLSSSKPAPLVREEEEEEEEGGGRLFNLEGVYSI